MKNQRNAKGDTFIVVTSDDAKFFNPNRIASSAHEALQRGKACLGCRRRKMRCDGLRPICTQCITRNRIDDCEYTDATSGPTRTQILEETLARLQARVKELEKPLPSNQPTVPTLALHDPLPPVPPLSSSSSSSSAPSTPESELRRRMLDFASLPMSISPANSSPLEPELHEPDEESWWELDEPPQEIASMLVRLFLPNSLQLGFALNVTRFLNNLAEPRNHPTYPHPSLMNAIYVWALRLSKEKDLQVHENLYLQRAIGALQNAVGGGLGSLNDTAFATRVLHVMQAEVLVAQYFFTHGRILEGRYHANAAVSLALSYGFHRLSPSFPGPSRPGVSLGLLTQALPPARSCLEFGERVSVFWSVYNIDRCWSVVGEPCIMSDDPAHGTQIDTPWPCDMRDYEMNDLEAELLRNPPCSRTIRRFLAGESPPQGVTDLSFAALRVKASTIHERAIRLAAAWKASEPGTTARQKIDREMRGFSVFLENFIDSLPQDVEHLEERITSSDSRRIVYTVFSIVYTTVIVLHEVWAEEGDGNQVESDICLEAAHHIARVPRAGVELGLLDPVLGTTGMILADMFVREVLRARKAPKTPENIERLKRIEDGLQYLKDTALWGRARPVYGLQVPRILAVIAKADKRN